MNIGKLRHRVELQDYTTAKDDFGQSVKTWSTYDTVWAWVRPLGGSERMAAQQPAAEITHKVTIRYHADIEANHRIKFGTRYLYINSIANYDEQNKFMEIVCKEKM